MRRLKLLDVTLLFTLTAVWGAAFVLHLREVASGRLAWVPAFVSAPRGAERYPTLVAFWSGVDGGREGLAVGDRLLRAGSSDLGGVGQLGFAVRVYAEARSDLTVPLVFERGGVAGEGQLRLVPVGQPWRIAPLVIAMALTGVVVLLRVPRAPIGRAVFLGAMAYATHWSLFPGGPPAQTYAWAALFTLSSAVMFPLCLRPALLFPQDIAPRDGRLPWWPWIFALFSPFATSWVFGMPFPHAIGQRGALTVNVAIMVTYLAVITRHYWRLGPVGQRQLKWVIYGFYVGLVPITAADAVAAFRPSLWWLHEVAAIFLIAVPICLVIGISRYNLFDINRLISLTAVYTLLSLVLVAAVLTVIPRLALLASASVGLDAGTVQLGLSLLSAGGLVLGGPYLRSHAERIFFPERHDLEVGFEQLLQRLSSCATPTALLTLAGEALASLLRPDMWRVYVATEGGYAPLAAPAVLPAPGAAPMAPVDDDTLALAALHTLRTPLEVTGHGMRGSEFSPGARAVLESLGVAVVVPVSRGDRAAALIILGAKRSGDVYTPTDMTLLRALADKLSSELLRFDEAETLRHERAVQEALSRYVPDPLVALLARGQKVEGGEREVSVLFVDLRSFTSYTERHGTRTAFSVVDRYTQEASGIINRHGGTVVEFLGDGMMAVFGAPEPLPSQARAAVGCAREIVSSVRALELGGAGDASIAVGIGITTGTAFVGDVRGADRLFYTAIGDVVNLAARLEGLTRNLNAAVAIDAATRVGAGDTAAPFRRHGPALVKGRDQAVEVYYLPLEEAGHMGEYRWVRPAPGSAPS